MNNVEKPNELFFIHIGMILSTLSLRINSFVSRFFPQKTSNQLNVVHVYILISFPIPNRQISFIAFGHTLYVKHHLSRDHHTILFDFHPHS